MLISNKNLQLFGILFALQIFVVIVVGLFSSDVSFLFANLFGDRLFVLLLIPMYMSGISVMEKNLTCSIMVRIGSRKKIMRERLKRYYLHTFAFWSVWYSVILTISVLLFKMGHDFSLIDYWGMFIKYMLGSIMLVHILIILVTSNNKLLSENAFIIVYVLLAIELLVIVPEIKIQTPFEFLFLFSWIIYGENLSYLILAIYNILLLGYIFKISTRKDII